MSKDITTLNYVDFIGYNSKQYHTYNYLLVQAEQSVSDVTEYGVISPKITAEPGKYTVNMVLNTVTKLHWMGDYIHSKSRTLKNGSNKFDITIHPNQTNEFTIGIYGNYTNTSSQFIIYDFSIVKKSDDFTDVIDIIQDIEDDIEDDIIDIENDFFTMYQNNKKNILLITDNENSTLYHIAQTVKKYLGSKYNIIIDCYLNLPDYSKKYLGLKMDMVVKFWYEHYHIDPFDVYPLAKKVLCVYDYIYWNKEINHVSLARYSEIFSSNINRSDFILYSCPKIKDLIIDNYGQNINRKLYPIFDGYDPEIFYYCEHLNSDKLRVGWVGNSNNSYKKFHTLKKIVYDHQWIELKIQDSNNFITRDQMINFYRDVDVVVCLSESEGTPNPILEASACGRPWISTNVGIVQMLNDISSISIKPGMIIENESELLDKLEILYRDRDLIKKMGIVGSECCKQTFTWENQINQFSIIFDQA